jgi:hypothetical protein
VDLTSRATTAKRIGNIRPMQTTCLKNADIGYPENEPNPYNESSTIATIRTIIYPSR